MRAEYLVSSLSNVGDATIAVRELEAKLGLQFFEGDMLTADLRFFSSAFARSNAADLDNIAGVQIAHAKMAAKAFPAALGALLA